MYRHPRLHKRGDTYYFRAKVPVDLIACYPGAEIKFSLRTRDRQVAWQRVQIESLRLDREFDEHRKSAVQDTVPLTVIRSGEGPAVRGLHCRRPPAARRCFSRRNSLVVSACSDEPPVRPAVPPGANGRAEQVVLRQPGTVHFSRSGRPAVLSGCLDATPCPRNTGAPRLPVPAQRALPRAGNRDARLRWTLRRLRSVRCLTPPGFPRLRLGARGFAPHCSTGILGDACGSTPVFDLSATALRLPRRSLARLAGRALPGFG